MLITLTSRNRNPLIHTFKDSSNSWHCQIKLTKKNCSGYDIHSEISFS